MQGHPKKIWSDPGTNFVGAKPVLEELYQFLDGLDKSAVEETSTQNGTDWRRQIQPAVHLILSLCRSSCSNCEEGVPESGERTRAQSQQTSDDTSARR